MHHQSPLPYSPAGLVYSYYIHFILSLTKMEMYNRIYMERTWIYVLKLTVLESTNTVTQRASACIKITFFLCALFTDKLQVTQTYGVSTYTLCTCRGLRIPSLIMYISNVFSLPRKYFLWNSLEIVFVLTCDCRGNPSIDLTPWWWYIFSNDVLMKHVWGKTWFCRVTLAVVAPWKLHIYIPHCPPFSGVKVDHPAPFSRVHPQTSSCAESGKHNEARAGSQWLQVLSHVQCFCLNRALVYFLTSCSLFMQIRTATIALRCGLKKLNCLFQVSCSAVWLQWS